MAEALAAALLVALVTTRLLGLFQVRGVSMLPALQEGDWILARRFLPWERPLKRQVVITVPVPSAKTLVKRVVLGPGDELPAAVEGTGSSLLAGEYLLQGDNQGKGEAITWIGPVARCQLWGRAWLVVWPLGRLRRVP